MSQSGEALLDSTMPDNPIGTSAFVLERKKEENIPLALRDLKEQLAIYEGPNAMAKWKRNTPNGQTIPSSLYKQNEPLSEVAFPMKSTDFLFTPNRAKKDHWRFR